MTNTLSLSFLEADWAEYSQLADKTRFFNKLHKTFLFWTMSHVAVPVVSSWMTATLQRVTVGSMQVALSREPTLDDICQYLYFD
jgi:hypothetical protein